MMEQKDIQVPVIVCGPSTSVSLNGEDPGGTLGTQTFTSETRCSFLQFTHPVPRGFAGTDF